MFPKHTKSTPRVGRMEAIPALDNGRVTETRLRTLNAHQALAALRYRSSLPDLHRPSANAASPPQTVEKLYRSVDLTPKKAVIN